MATSASAAGSTAFTSDGDTDAEMSTNRAPIRICTSVPWNSSISDTSILRWLARAAPISVVATKPASSRMRSAPTRAAATIMSTAGTAWRGTVRCVSCSRNHRTAAASRADRGAHQDAEEHLPRAPQLPAGAGGERRVEDDDAEQGADRIDEHPLPHQQRAHPWRRADERQQRQHHGRARDDEHGADEQRHEIAEVIEEQGRRGPDAGPRHQYPDGDEQADRPAYVARDLPHREAQAGLEQDQPHGEGHERLVERAEQRVGVDVVGGDAGQEADGQEDHDGRQPQAPGQQLRADREHDHEPETEQHVVGRHVRPSSPRGREASSSKRGDRAQITRFGG